MLPASLCLLRALGYQINGWERGRIVPVPVVADIPLALSVLKVETASIQHEWEVLIYGK